jgi:hypothetical protein
MHIKVNKDLPVGSFAVKRYPQKPFPMMALFVNRFGAVFLLTLSFPILAFLRAPVDAASIRYDDYGEVYGIGACLASPAKTNAEFKLWQTLIGYSPSMVRMSPLIPFVGALPYCSFVVIPMSCCYLSTI